MAKIMRASTLGVLKKERESLVAQLEEQKTIEDKIAALDMVINFYDNTPQLLSAKRTIQAMQEGVHAANEDTTTPPVENVDNSRKQKNPQGTLQEVSLNILREVGPLDFQELVSRMRAKGMDFSDTSLRTMMYRSINFEQVNGKWKAVVFEDNKRGG